MSSQSAAHLSEYRFHEDEDGGETVGSQSISSEVAQQLRIRNFKVEREEGAVIYFKEGHYNDTGMSVIGSLHSPFDKLVNLHRLPVPSLSVLSLFCCMLFFDILLMFMFGSEPENSAE